MTAATGGKSIRQCVVRRHGLTAAAEISRPQFRLRAGEVRVFYDVSGDKVEVLAIVEKSETETWLAQFGSLE